MRRLGIALVVFIAVSASAFGQTTGNAPATTAKRLAGVASWGYQLQRVQVAEIAASPFDLVVIDYSRNGTEARRFSPAEVKAMQVKTDGSRRLVLAYMSIGEAEDYRYYWSKSWVEPAPLRAALDTAPSSPPVSAPPTVLIPRLVAPGWLGRENERWKGNYHVRFWYDGWQELIMHNADSYLNRIIEAGFDGVYLDRVDAYYAIERDVPGSRHWMISFVVELATLARKRKPDFAVVPQNAEELLEEPRYLAAIDGIGKEDLLFSGDRDGKRNSERQIASSGDNLKRATAAGLTVLVVEYLEDEAAIAVAGTELRSRGLIPYFGPRGLDRLMMAKALDGMHAPQPDPAAAAPAR